MERTTSVILFAAIIVVLVGATVFLVGNSPAAAPSNVNASISASNESILGNSTAQSVTSEELASHDSKEDCWVGYEGKVYDLTAWLPKHPGSSGAIEPYCGTSSQFEAAFSGQHGKSQVNTLIRESEFKGELSA